LEARRRLGAKAPGDADDFYRWPSVAASAYVERLTLRENLLPDGPTRGCTAP